MVKNKLKIPTSEVGFPRQHKKYNRDDSTVVYLHFEVLSHMNSFLKNNFFLGGEIKETCISH